MVIKLPAVSGKVFTEEFERTTEANKELIACVLTDDSFLAARFDSGGVIIIITTNLFPGDGDENRWRRSSFFIKNEKLYAISHKAYDNLNELISDLPVYGRHESFVEIITK